MRPDTHRETTSQSISGAFLFMMLASIALLTLNLDASAQAPAQPASPKLYIFDLGSLKSGNPKPLLDRGVTVTDMSVVAYLVVHPRGTLQWDTGTIPDELVKPGGTTVERATVHKTLSGQLAEIGYKPADITYVILDGDHDVFGDGSVVIISTPGHTPGHQSLFVRLKNFGPVVLSGDLYHYPSERTLKDFLPFGGRGNDAQEAASKAKVEALLKEKDATLWIQHDIIADAKLKKSPAYYD
jgi:glyoxylase-like metal-dependent hydrolase (beta-lactamase superfamily II)